MTIRVDKEVTRLKKVKDRNGNEEKITLSLLSDLELLESMLGTQLLDL